MLNKDNFSNIVSVITGTFALTNIQDILSIIILVISIINILFNMIIKIYSKIKNKEYYDIPNELEKTKEELQNLQDKENK